MSAKEVAVAPAIFDQGPENEEDFCHCELRPVAEVTPVAESVKELLGQPTLDVIVARPAFGVPVHGGKTVPFNTNVPGHGLVGEGQVSSII